MMVLSLIIYESKKLTHKKYILDFIYSFLLIVILGFLFEIGIVWVSKIKWQHHSDNDGYYHFNHFPSVEFHIFCIIIIALLAMIFTKTINIVLVNWNDRQIVLKYTKLLIPEEIITISFIDFSYDAAIVVTDSDTNKREYKIKLYSKCKLVFAFTSTDVNMSLDRFEKEVITPLKVIIEHKNNWQSKSNVAYFVN